MAGLFVAEKIGDSGIALLQEHFDVDLGAGWDRDELAAKIGAYDGILIRSATKLDAELLGHATNLKAVGRAGVGVDNVDVPVATKRGIVVANAPQSNVVTAAEHTMALLLALARNVPQAHAALKAGRWDRKNFMGTELYGKTPAEIQAMIDALHTLVERSGIERVHMLAWRDLDDVEAGGSEVHAHNIASLWSQSGLEVMHRTSFAAGRPQHVRRSGYAVVRKAGRYMVFPRSVAAELARLALFLTTPAARHITGQTLHVGRGALANFG